MEASLVVLGRPVCIAMACSGLIPPNPTSRTAMELDSCNWSMHVCGCGTAFSPFSRSIAFTGTGYALQTAPKAPVPLTPLGNAYSGTKPHHRHVRGSRLRNDGIQPCGSEPNRRLIRASERATSSQSEGPEPQPNNFLVVHIRMRMAPH